MWRVRFPDGRLSDMVNDTRARDAAASIALAILSEPCKKRPAVAVGALKPSGPPMGRDKLRRSGEAEPTMS